MSALNRVLKRYQDSIRVKVLHDRQFFDALDIQNKEFEPFCPYQQYHQVLHSSDIALLPLEPTEFNRFKSDLKFLECAGHGAAVLASPTVYEESIIEGETGLIYRSVEGFEENLERLIRDPEGRHRMVANAYHWVRENRMLSRHYRQRHEWYLQMRDALPRLTEALSSRVPELFKD